MLTFIDKFRNNKITFLLLCIMSGGLIYNYHDQDRLLPGIGYLFTMLLLAIVADFVLLKTKDKARIDNPKKETLVVFLVYAIIMLGTLLRFGVIENSIPKPAFLILLILFIFPTFLLLYFLKFKKYTWAEIGYSIKKRFFLPTFILIGILAASTYLWASEQIQFQELFDQFGWSTPFVGFVMAAIPEETIRHLGQTRLGHLLKNKGIGWFLTSAVWAIVHFATFNKGGEDSSEALLGCLQILPIGLLWGYLSFRVNSIFPSVLIHGTNYWGFQNV